jgi:hypothetical protein
MNHVDDVVWSEPLIGAGGKLNVRHLFYLKMVGYYALFCLQNQPPNMVLFSHPTTEPWVFPFTKDNFKDKSPLARA